VVVLRCGERRAARYDYGLEQFGPSSRVPTIHRIPVGIEVLMQRSGIKYLSVFRIAAQEPARRWIVVSGAEVVETEVGVELFATIEVVVRCRPNFRERIPEGVVLVAIRQ